jgi:hypothetical protein
MTNVTVLDGGQGFCDNITKAFEVKIGGVG